MVNIVIIDSDKFIIENLDFGFRQHNIKVLTTQDPDEELKIIKETPSCLIILELVLPRKSGFDFLEQKNREPDLKDIPVFVYSTLSQESDKQRAISLGVIEYWCKSEYSCKEVVEKIVEFIMKKSTGK